MDRVIANRWCLNKNSDKINGWAKHSVNQRNIFLKKFSWVKISDDEENGESFVPRCLSELSYNDDLVIETKIFGMNGKKNDW